MRYFFFFSLLLEDVFFDIHVFVVVVVVAGCKSFISIMATFQIMLHQHNNEWVNEWVNDVIRFSSFLINSCKRSSLFGFLFYLMPNIKWIAFSMPITSAAGIVCHRFFRGDKGGNIIGGVCDFRARRSGFICEIVWRLLQMLLLLLQLFSINMNWWCGVLVVCCHCIFNISWRIVLRHSLLLVSI